MSIFCRHKFVRGYVRCTRTYRFKICLEFFGVCGKCGTRLMVERVSFDGETWIEEDLNSGTVDKDLAEIYIEVLDEAHGFISDYYNHCCK